MMLTQQETLSDELSYARLRAGDPSALDLLIDRYYQPIFGFFYRRTANRFLAEDLAQDVFTRLLTYQGTPPAQFHSWIFTIAANRIRDHFRSASYRCTQPMPEESSTVQLPGPPPLGANDTRLCQIEQRQDLAAAIRQLPPSLRIVLALRFSADLPMEEIARRLGLPTGTVKSRLFRALRALRALLSASTEPTPQRSALWEGQTA